MFALFTQPDTILPLSQGNCQIQSAKIVDVIANYGPDGNLAGLEILDASLLLGEEIKNLVFEISPALALVSPSG